MRASMVFRLAQGLREQAQVEEVEMLFLGAGVELLRLHQANTPQFAQFLQGVQGKGIRVMACRNSLDSYGLTEERIFPVDIVLGGAETARLNRSGFQILTF